MTKQQILEAIHEIYKENHFTNYCGIEIRDVGCGWGKVGIIVELEKHTNVNGSLHGGMFFTLMDNATGVAGSSIGKRVVTLTSSVVMMKGAKVGDNLEATARVVGQDGDRVNMQMELRNLTTGTLMAEATSCMLVKFVYPNIPSRW